MYSLWNIYFWKVRKIIKQFKMPHSSYKKMNFEKPCSYPTSSLKSFGKCLEMLLLTLWLPLIWWLAPVAITPHHSTSLLDLEGFTTVRLRDVKGLGSSRDTTHVIALGALKLHAANVNVNANIIFHWEFSNLSISNSKHPPQIEIIWKIYDLVKYLRLTYN